LSGPGAGRRNEPLGGGDAVDRRSRLLRLIHLPGGHRSEQLLDALSAQLMSVPPAKRLTLTWDQGSEMARHDQIAALFGQGVYFADPGSPWMRGTNENTVSVGVARLGR
jgi:IS30 family transposase